MIAISLLLSVGVLALHYLQREDLHRRADRIGAVAFPLVFGALLR